MRLAVSLVLLVSLVTSSVVQARKPEDVFRKQVMIVGKRVPFRFSSGENMISFFKSNRKEHIWPTKEGKWTFEFMSFFSEPLQDFVVTVKFYDVSDGNKRFVQAYDENAAERGLRTLHSSITLEKPEFQPNRRYQIAVTNRGQVLAQATFMLRGEGEKHSGKVEFSDEETKGP